MNLGRDLGVNGLRRKKRPLPMPRLHIQILKFGKKTGQVIIHKSKRNKSLKTPGVRPWRFAGIIPNFFFERKNTMPEFIMVFGDKTVNMTKDIKNAKSEKDLKTALKKALKKTMKGKK
jgi:hypothetical protein